MGKARQSTLRNDLFGGLVSVSLAIPLAMGYGMFAFTALGDSYFAHGALADLYAAIAAGVICVALGDRTTTVYAPRVTTTFLLGVVGLEREPRFVEMARAEFKSRDLGNVTIVQADGLIKARSTWCMSGWS